MDQADHPVTYLPALLGILGPQLIPLYKAALSGKRIVSAPGSSTLYGFSETDVVILSEPSSFSTFHQDRS